MAYFEGQTPGWVQQSSQQHRRQDSWDRSQPVSRSGSAAFFDLQSPAQSLNLQLGASSVSQLDEQNAFGSQFEEIARASDNLAKSGKWFGFHGRRDSMPAVGTFSRQYGDFETRSPGPHRHHSVSEYDGLRTHSSSSVQGYLANQRFGSRQSETEQMMQAKRRAAAQRERDLRNYHQEQQYNRTSAVSGAKSDRSMSPSGMSEDDRRELIARQHRALYGDTSSLYMGPPGSGGGGDTGSGPPSRGAFPSSGHGSSPLAYEPYNPAGGDGAQPPSQAQGQQGQQTRSRANSASSKSPNPNPNPAQSQFALFDSAQQNRTSTSSPGGSPTRGAQQPAPTPVGPIGSRPLQHPGPARDGQGKRGTPPMPSPLSYGLSSEKGQGQAQNQGQSQEGRSNSAASNPATTSADKGVNTSSLGGWGPPPSAGPWSNSRGNASGVQASVWG